MTISASWAPERVIDRAHAERLIAASFPELKGLAVRPLAQGWDNSVLLVGDELVFRFPRRAMAVAGVHREIAVLPVIGPLLTLPIPTPAYVGVDEHATEPWPFFGARLVPGNELALSNLAETERVRAAADAGAFLRVLHAPGTLAAVQRTNADLLQHDPMHRAWPRSRIADTRQLLDTLAHNGAWEPDERIRLLLLDAESLEPPDTEPSLLHGDFHLRHLLVDGRGEKSRATGVIDWGDLCIGDPAVDVSFGYSAFEAAARNAFLDAYGDIDAERELRARALAIRLCATLASYALDTGQQTLANESLLGVHRAVA